MMSSFIFLKNEIEFDKSELRQTNIIITALIKSSEKVSEVETRQITNDQHNFDNQSVNDLLFNKVNSKVIGDNNKHDYIVLANDSKTKKLKNIPTIEIIADINATNPKGLSTKNNVVRNHPGCTTEDLTSYSVPTIKKNRDVIIRHRGANDLTNDKDTIQNLQHCNI